MHPAPRPSVAIGRFDNARCPGHSIEHFVADDEAVEFYGQFGELCDLVLVLGQGVGKVAALAFGQIGGNFNDVVVPEAT